jgi:hypothetical protein
MAVIAQAADSSLPGWAETATIAACLTVVLAVVVPWLVYRAGRGVARDEKTTSERSSSLSLRRRRDELAALLAKESDLDYLHELLLEVLRDFHGRDQLILRKIYYQNRAVPLLQRHEAVEVVNGIIETLIPRYAQTSTERGLRELTVFASTNVGAGTHRDRIISVWLAERVRCGDLVGESAVAMFLTSGNMDLTAACVYLVGEEVPAAAKVNILMGSCGALMERDPDSADEMRLRRGVGEGDRMSVIDAMAQIMHVDKLRSMGSWGKEPLDGMAVPLDYLAAVVVRTTGALSASIRGPGHDGDLHCARRCLEAVPAMLGSFGPHSVGGTGNDLLDEGIRDFRRQAGRPRWAKAIAEAQNAISVVKAKQTPG